MRLRPGHSGASDFNLVWRDLSRLLHDLPAMPDSVRMLQHHLNHSPVDLSAIGWIVRRDPALAAQILKLANTFIAEDSPCIIALEECLVLLGLDCLRGHLLQTSAEWPSQQIRRLEELRQHSALAAALSRNIAETLGYPDPERVYFAGLLHDLGKLPPIMLATDPGATPAGESSASGEMVAHSGFIMDHCVFGAWLAAIWKLPGFVADSIEYHHDVEKAHIEPWVVKMVSAGNHLSHALLGDRDTAPVDGSRDVHIVLRRLLPSLSWAQTTTLQRRVGDTYRHWQQEQDEPAAGATRSLRFEVQFLQEGKS